MSNIIVRLVSRERLVLELRASPDQLEVQLAVRANEQPKAVEVQALQQEHDGPLQCQDQIPNVSPRQTQDELHTRQNASFEAGPRMFPLGQVGPYTVRQPALLGSVKVSSNVPPM